MTPHKPLPGEGTLWVSSKQRLDQSSHLSRDPAKHFPNKSPPPKDSKQRWPEERDEETDFFLQPGVKFMLVKTNKGQKRKSTTKEKYKTIMICVPGRQDGSIFS